jgi:hypothetical protein
MELYYSNYAFVNSIYLTREDSLIVTIIELDLKFKILVE